MISCSFSAGFCDITPRVPIHLGCNGDKASVFSHVDSPLEINGLLLCLEGLHVMFLSVDTLYVTNALRDAILDEVRDCLPKNTAFFWGATHTHRAPFLDPSKPNLGYVNPDYCAFFVQKAASLVRSLVTKPLQTGQLVWKSGQIPELSVNRRRWLWSIKRPLKLIRELSFAPNPAGKTNDTCTLLEVQNAQNKTHAILWSYPCHPTGYPEKNHVSAHYPGTVREQIRETLGADLAVLNFQGFCGDSRPNFTGWPKTKGEWVSFLLNGVKPFRDCTYSEYASWTRRLGDGVLKTLQSNGMAISPALKSVAGTLPQKTIHYQDNTETSIQFHAIHLSKTHVILGVSAEIVVDYLDLIKAHFPDKTCMALGCIHETFGYYPTQTMLKEGGYESKGFLTFFSLKGKFPPDLESTFLQAIGQVLNHDQT